MKTHLLLKLIFLSCMFLLIQNKIIAQSISTQESLVSILTSGEVYKGTVSLQNTSWPVEIKFENYDKHRNVFSGEMTWPTLSTITKIKGKITFSELVFTSVAYIKRGESVIGTTFNLAFKTPLNMQGNWNHRAFNRQRGKYISLTIPIKIKNNERIATKQKTKTNNILPTNSRTYKPKKNRLVEHMEASANQKKLDGIKIVNKEKIKNVISEAKIKSRNDIPLDEYLRDVKHNGPIVKQYESFFGDKVLAYEGQIVNGKRHGKGSTYWAMGGGIEFKGYWRNNFIIYGTYYTSEKVYEGEFDKKNWVEGTLFHDNKKPKYIGKFKRKPGETTWYGSNLFYFHGYGTLYDYSGKIDKQGIWDNNILIKSTSTTDNNNSKSETKNSFTLNLNNINNKKLLTALFEEDRKYLKGGYVRGGGDPLWRARPLIFVHFLIEEYGKQCREYLSDSSTNKEIWENEYVRSVGTTDYYQTVLKKTIYLEQENVEVFNKLTDLKFALLTMPNSKTVIDLIYDSRQFLKNQGCVPVVNKMIDKAKIWIDGDW